MGNDLKSIVIGNGLIERVFSCNANAGRFFTARMVNKKTGTNWVVGESPEFRVKIAADGEGGGRNYADLTNGSLAYENHATRRRPNGITQLIVRLTGVNVPVRLHLSYELHSDCAWIKKRITVENIGATPFMLLNYDTELLNLPGNLTARYFASWRWGGQFADKGVSVGVGMHAERITEKVLAPPSVPRESPLLVHNAADSEGLWVLPEIPIRGVTVAAVGGQVRLGAPNPCARRILPGQTADLDAGVVIGAYRGNYQAGFEHFRRYLQDFVIREDRAKKALLVYNTWYGQGFQVDEATCRREIDVSAELGLEMFVLDAGWHSNLGDWEPDKSKFPHGLEALSAYCHKRNMKFGLWLDARLASKDSEIYRRHPEWGHKCANGLTYGQPDGQTFFGHPLVCMCLGSDYGEYLRERFVRLVARCELDGVKIDNCGYGQGTEPHQRIASFWDDCHGVGHRHLSPAAHNESWLQYAAILDAIRKAQPNIVIESIPCGLSWLDKYDIDWISDYFFPFRSCGVDPQTDWRTETHYMRTLNYYMAYTHPIAAIHQGWVDPQSSCLETMCASVFGGNLWTGVTGFIEKASVAQKEVIKKWIRWHKANRRYLSVYQHLPAGGQPVIPLRGKQETVDGFAHLLADGGWIFLFNPTAKAKDITLELGLTQYGLTGFSGIVPAAHCRFDAETNRLTIARRVPAFSHVRMFVNATSAAGKISKEALE